MNKKELVEEITKNLRGVSKSKVAQAVDVFLEVIKESLSKGEKVTLSGFGSFYLSQRQEKKGINPQTKQPMTIPAAVVPKFRSGKKLKKTIK